MLAWKGCASLHISAFQLRHQRYVYHFEDIPWLMRLATSNGLSIHRGFIEGGNCNMVFLVLERTCLGIHVPPWKQVFLALSAVTSCIRDADMMSTAPEDTKWDAVISCFEKAVQTRLLPVVLEWQRHRGYFNMQPGISAIRFVTWITRKMATKFASVPFCICAKTQLQRYDSVANLLTNGSAASESVSPILTNPLCSCLSVVSPQVNHMAHWPILQGNLSQV